jgi:hypothetical protein
MERVMSKVDWLLIKLEPWRQRRKLNKAGFSDRAHSQWFSSMTIKEYEAMRARVEADNDVEDNGWRDLRDSFEAARQQRMAEGT